MPRGYKHLSQNTSNDQLPVSIVVLIIISPVNAITILYLFLQPDACSRKAPDIICEIIVHTLALVSPPKKKKMQSDIQHQ